MTQLLSSVRDTTKNYDVARSITRWQVSLTKPERMINIVWYRKVSIKSTQRYENTWDVSLPVFARCNH